MAETDEQYLASSALLRGPVRTAAQIPGLALLLVCFLTACTTATRQAPDTGASADEITRSPIQWIETDAVVTVRNQAVADQIRMALQETPLPTPLSFESVRVREDFATLRIEIEAQAGAETEKLQAVTLEGRVDFSYAGNGLSWWPHIEQIHGLEPGIETDALLQRVNEALTRHLVIGRRNDLGLGLQPPTALQLQAGLQGLGGGQQSQQFALDGAYTVAASMVRTNPDHTVFALDLEFVDGLSHCNSDFSISRAVFAGEIRNREPRNIARQVPAAAPQWHYFTEVSDTRRAFTLVHYWFADGRAVGVTELPVEPSARWRTWSTLPVMPGTVHHIEVFAAERDTGCILSGAHIEVTPGEQFAPSVFQGATGDFRVETDKDVAAAAEFTPMAMASTVNDALRDTRFPLRFESGIAFEQPLSGAFVVHDTASLQCTAPDCSVETECRVDFSRCQRMQDSRECTTCLFRNPLNNRCMSEQVDAACETRKASLNSRYSREWESCMAREQSAQAACELRGQEAVEVCEARAAEFTQACTANQAALQQHNGPVATISGEGRAAGALTVAFTELEVSANLSSLQGMVSLAPDLSVEGELLFEPGANLGSLGECIGQWSGPLNAHFDRPQAPRRLAAPLQFSNGALAAEWPGLTMPIAMNHGPVETVLQDEPGRLASCMPGLTESEVGTQVAGDEGLFLRGILAVDVTEAAASIVLPELSTPLGNEQAEARAFKHDSHFRYEWRMNE